MRRELYTCLLLSALIFVGCGQMSEIMESSKKIEEVIKANCDCDEVRLVSYGVHNLTTTAYYEVVGCTFTSLDDETERILGHLKKEVPDFCEIDELALDFINKYERQRKVIKHCEIED